MFNDGRDGEAGTMIRYKEVFKRSITMGNGSFDPHTEPHYGFTVGQLTFFIIWLGALCHCMLRVISPRNGSDTTKNTEDQMYSASDTNGSKHRTHDQETKQTHTKTDEVENNQAEVKVKLEIEVNSTDVGKNNTGNKGGSTGNATFSTPTYDEFLRGVVTFGAIMIYFYLCDYRKIFPKLARVYDRDVFLFLVFLLFLVGTVFTIQPTKDKILNRDQTEEWKGWMQVLFVWYHVFAAAEWYNWIRVYIAAYVWMTGFGNFSFFWIRKDFSLWRFLKMQFRLNFLVTAICVVTSNQYMLYYICAMHSYWFITVYVFMGTLSSWNTDSKKMAIKFAAYFVVNFVIFDVSVVRDNIFKPFSFLLQYNDPRFTPIHEWTFRAGLDHWACFAGMLCAYNYPYFETFMQTLEKNDPTVNRKRNLAIKVTMITVALVTLCVWYKAYMEQDKFSYNVQHPYTSWIPIIAFIIIRNSFPVLRQYYIGMFAWLGKITLETYLSQLHIYLQSNAKHLIGYFSADYRLLNFALATIIYLPISYTLFNLTTTFSSYLLPKDLKLIGKNAILCCIIFGVPYALIAGLAWVL